LYVSGYIKAPPYPPELSKKAIELTVRCLAMDSEKLIIINEALLDAWISVSPASPQKIKMEIQ
jgi:hypothetical protein